jgi:hypothetical protein
MIRRHLSRACRVVRFVWWHDFKQRLGLGRAYAEYHEENLPK